MRTVATKKKENNEFRWLAAKMSEEELKKRISLLNEENERLKSVLDSTIQLIRRENDAKLADIELHNAQRDAQVRC